MLFACKSMGHRHVLSCSYCPTLYEAETFGHEALQILSLSLTGKTHLCDLFGNTNFNKFKDLYEFLILGLFD